MEKILVIFANSIKHSQHCIAGKDIFTKEWIRPVGDKNGCELTNMQVIVKNPYGSFLTKVLQKVKIKFDKHAPLINQPENYIISNKNWIQNYNLNKNEIINYLDNPNNLWLYKIDERKDRVNYQLILNGTIKIFQSLYLIRVNKIHIYWKNRIQFNQNPQRRGIFQYNNIIYDLAITDPNFKEFKEQDLLDKFLCISLGENLNGFCYKIIATIF